MYQRSQVEKLARRNVQNSHQSLPTTDRNPQHHERKLPAEYTVHAPPSFGLLNITAEYGKILKVASFLGSQVDRYILSQACVIYQTM